MNRISTALFSLTALVATATPLAAQQLESQLLKEAAPRLAVAAREQGNAARGAVLFADQKLGCANCHAAGRNDLLGPDLGRLGKVTDESIVESILQPSKVIRKGYETTIVELSNGTTVAGRMMERTKEQLVLRENSATRTVRRISLNDVEDSTISAVSSMPAKLGDQFANRQGFLDVVRYVISVVEAGPTDVIQQRPTGQRLKGRLHGIALLNRHQCSLCHQSSAFDNSLSNEASPDLKWLSGQISPDYLKAFIANPHAVKPGTRMPNMLSQVPTEERELVATQISDYIDSLSDRSFTTTPIEEAAIERGEQIFHSVGCVACHNPRTSDGVETSVPDSVAMGPLKNKYSAESLAKFLRNPHAVRPGGRMPDLKLTHFEATDLASFLLQGQRSFAQASDQPQPEQIALGRQQFQKNGCVVCHQPERPVENVALTPIASDRLNHGCLSTEPGPWPVFDLSESDRIAMKLALSASTADINDSDRLAVHLTSFRCLNCHSRDELGGVADDRDSYFQTTNPNLGPQGRIPPTLTGVGAKLKPVWMRQVLVRGRSIRPYVKTRMPLYGTDNIAHLVPLFGLVDRQAELPVVKHDIEDKLLKEAGQKLAGTEGLNCIVCHTFQLKPAATMPAVDLTDMSERLQPDWFRRYMKDPQRLSLNTVMPSFWPGGRAIRPGVLNGNTDHQIAALWRWLEDGRQARTPRGLIRKPMELLATDEAVMLRRSYPGIGKRGIGVGYPAEANLAFDAEQLRLAMIWKGKFLDPGGVWRSQGHGTARPLSRPIEFTKGPDVWLKNQPWVSENDRPATHKFQGYFLDKLRRPTFQYRIQEVEVADYYLDQIETQPSSKPAESAVLRRTLTLKSPVEHTVQFRIASGKQALQSADAFRIDDQLTVRIADQQAASVLTADDGQHVILEIRFKGERQIVVDYLW